MRNTLAVFGLLSILSLASAQGPAKPNLNFQQSAPRPAPEWLKIIDHGQFDARLKGYFAPEGLKIEIVAEAPDVINPVGMTFGPDGTLYVLEWVEVPANLQGPNFPKAEVEFTYKDGTKRKVLIARKPIRDRVKALTLNAKTGRFEPLAGRASDGLPKGLILQEDLPSSILIHDGWMYLSGQGTVRRYKQLDGGKWGPKEVIAQGFCGWHHHQVSGLTIGNDGWLYITSGDDDNYVEGSDGSRATVLRTGAIFRCKPDGSKMHVHSIGYRNPYRDVAFDAAFNMFHVDNDNEDGSKWTGCRLMHVPEGVDFGWRLRPGANCCVPDLTRSAVYGELPGKVTPMLKTGRGAPAGLLIYNDTFFPPPYRGLLYYPDVFRKVIRAYQVHQDGASFEVSHEFEFLRSADPLFRPCQMVLGPDGAMYICDWRTDSGGAGKLWGDGKNGRIYRVSWKGTEAHEAIKLRSIDSWAKIAKLPEDELFKTLESDNFSDRLRAQQEIVRRGPKHRQALFELIKDDSKPTPARIAALGALQGFKEFDPGPFIDRLNDFSADTRRLSADALALHCKKGDGDAHEALVQAAGDEDLNVRRAVFLAIGKIGNPAAGDVIVNGLQFDKRLDDYLTDGLVRALEYTGKDGIQKLLALADSGSDKDLERVLDIYPSLRSREAALQLPALLKNYHVTPEQKVALIRCYTYYQHDPPVSLDPLVKFLDDLPGEPTKKISAAQLNAMKLAALDVLAAGGRVDSDRIKKTLLAMLKTDDAKTRSALLKTIAEARLTSAAPILIEQLKAADSDAERLPLVRTLGEIGDRAAFDAFKPLLASKDPAMRIEVLRALGNIDNRPALKLAESLLADNDVQVQREAVVMLGQNVDGARIVGKRFLDKKLPRSLLAEVSDSLRRFASPEYADVTELLGRVVKGGLMVSTEPAELKRISDMIAKEGSPDRGRRLFLNHKAVACALCHRLEGFGGSVGPDLTRVWETLSLEKTIETMLDPSKEIKEGYQTFVATTKSGRVVNGLKITQNAKELILRDVTGKDVRIAADDLADVVMSKQSLMPDDVVKHLSLREFIDLVAFLRDRKAQEELRGLIVSAWAIGPFDIDLAKPLPLEKNPNPAAVVLTPDKERLRWTALQADVGGKGLDLRPVIGREPASAYVLAYVYSPKDQKAELRWECDEKGYVLLNGERVALTDGRAPLVLKAGWNTLLARIANEEASPFVSARIVGDGVRVALMKD